MRQESAPATRRNALIQLLATLRETGNEGHPAAGHDPPLDDPAWVIERMRCWLAGDQNAT